MGSGVSTLIPCLKSSGGSKQSDGNQQPDLIFCPSEPLDETLGHSFCYVRSSNRFLSPTPSDRFVSPSGSFRLSPPHEPGSGPVQRTRGPGLEQQQQTGGFKAISGASVGANTSTPRTVLHLDNIYDDATDNTLGGCPGYGVRSSIVNAHGFESTSLFSALPLQPVPRVPGSGPDPSGPRERSGFFMSGPLESGAMSGPLDPAGLAPGSDTGSVPFSAPLGGAYAKKRKKKRKKSFSWYSNFSERKQRPWVVPVLNFVGGGKKEPAVESAAPSGDDAGAPDSHLQWALGKAGEDRVHVVVSEEQGWLFVGIYDGFNGPDAPEFLMGNLYRSVYNELQGLFWEVDEQKVEETNQQIPTAEIDSSSITSSVVEIAHDHKTESKDSAGASTSHPPPEDVKSDDASVVLDQDRLKRVTFHHKEIEVRTRRRLWEFLAEDDPEDGLDLSGSERFAFSVDDAISVSNADPVVNKRWLLLSKLKQGLSKHREGISGRKLFPWRFGLEDKGKEEAENRVEERAVRSGKRRKVGPIDHELVLRAMSRALERTELGFLEMTDKVLDTNPELALMGSCLLVVLMRDEDVYVMNVGDSRAIVAKYVEDEGSSVTGGGDAEGLLNERGKDKDMCATSGKECVVPCEAPSEPISLAALQLSTDHSTSIEEEVTRIKNEHPDDNQCIVNDRVKGRLKVTRAFGAGFLKQPKLNDALLGMFRNDYIGTTPYISCTPSLHHHRLCQRDQFLILSSDGLYQYLTNQEVVSLVENFMERFPEGDPAQHLIEELLVRAAKKAGMDFHDLLDIPQGDRRKYHDDVTVMVISLEGRIWKSSGKYL